MFIIYLRLAENKAKAPEFMAGHNEWIARGVEDGVFLVVGSLRPEGGGAIIAHGEDRPLIEARVAADPFVRESVVTVEIQEVAPVRTDKRLSFLLDADVEKGS